MSLSQVFHFIEWHQTLSTIGLLVLIIGSVWLARHHPRWGLAVVSLIVGFFGWQLVIHHHPSKHFINTWGLYVLMYVAAAVALVMVGLMLRMAFGTAKHTKQPPARKMRVIPRSKPRLQTGPPEIENIDDLGGKVRAPDLTDENFMAFCRYEIDHGRSDPSEDPF